MNTSTTNHELSTPQTMPPPPASPKTIITIVFVAGLLLWLVAFGPIEVARWYLAAARNSSADGEYADAITKATNGLKWKSDYEPLYELRAAAKLELGDTQGANDDVDSFLELSKTGDRFNESDVQRLTARTALLQKLDRHKDAIESMDRIVAYRQQQHEANPDPRTQYAYAMSLNNRAYLKAQARLDLEAALNESRQSIALLGKEDDPVLNDTLGYLLLLNAEPEEALNLLSQATELQKINDRRAKTMVRNRMRAVQDQRPLQDQLRRIDEQYSIIVHHRGEAYDALGEKEKAESDFAEAKRLGYSPEKGIW